MLGFTRELHKVTQKHVKPMKFETSKMGDISKVAEVFRVILFRQSIFIIKISSSDQSVGVIVLGSGYENCQDSTDSKNF